MKRNAIAIARVCNSFNMLVPEVAQLSAQHDKLLDRIVKAKGAERKKLVAKADTLRGKINNILLGT